MTRVAILIDGGYLLKRLPAVRPDVDITNAKLVAGTIEELVRSHLEQLQQVHRVSHVSQLLYRSFYYDAKPYDRKAHMPISGKSIDYVKSAPANFRRELFNHLRARPNFAVRLGYVQKSGGRSWILDEKKQKQLLKREIEIDGLVDGDFVPAFRQKGVDMRIGLDIASITLKRQASIIVLVSGDADFVPAAKLARREGMQFILDPLWQNVSKDLSEHIDILRSGFHRPKIPRHSVREPTPPQGYTAGTNV